MRFTEVKTLQLRGEPGGKVYGWVDYTWCEQTQQWRYHSQSAGFTHKHDLPYEFTEAERLLLAIKLSSN